MSNHTAKAFALGLVLLFLVTASSAYAQMPPGMPVEVSGKYVNAASGVEITFPVGWSGVEIAAPQSLLVVTTRGGDMSGDSQTMTSITMVVTDKVNRDPKDPSSFNNDALTCNPPVVTSRTVAGVQGVDATVECPSTSQKIRAVTVETSSNFIVVMYTSPVATFDSELASFNSAVDSLTVQGAVSAQGSGDQGGAVNLGVELKAITESVTLSGKPVSVDLRSNSTISNFAVNESNKQVTFKAEGETGTHGTTEVAIGKLLRGPYTVTVDGQSTSDFKVMGDEASADAKISVSYTHSSHDIAITGTTVVPEFPLAMIGAAAGIVGVVAVLGRTRLFKI